MFKDNAIKLTGYQRNEIFTSKTPESIHPNFKGRRNRKKKTKPEKNGFIKTGRSKKTKQGHLTSARLGRGVLCR